MKKIISMFVWLVTTGLCWGYRRFKKIVNEWKLAISLSLVVILANCIWMLCTFCCEVPNQGELKAKEIEDVNYASSLEQMETDIPPYLNSVAGHDERNTIVGNFSGHGIDTIYVVTENASEGFDVKYWAICSNPKIPKVELWGHKYYQPKLVFEGDLDGNGTDEWGYLHTWLDSQWRTYRVYTLVGQEWRFLTNDFELLRTPEYFRASGCEVIEPGPEKGMLKIHYGSFGVKCEIIDTIVAPTYSKINE